MIQILFFTIEAPRCLVLWWFLRGKHQNVLLAADIGILILNLEVLFANFKRSLTLIIWCKLRLVFLFRMLNWPVFTNTFIQQAGRNLKLLFSTELLKVRFAIWRWFHRRCLNGRLQRKIIIVNLLITLQIAIIKMIINRLKLLLERNIIRRQCLLHRIAATPLIYVLARTIFIASLQAIKWFGLVPVRFLQLRLNYSLFEALIKMIQCSVNCTEQNRWFLHLVLEINLWLLK